MKEEDTDLSFYRKQGETCAFTYAKCPECPFPLCFYEHKRTAVAAVRHQLVLELRGKCYKARAIALILSIAPSTVRRIISEEGEFG